MRFKINEWVAHQVTVNKDNDPASDVEQRVEPGRGRISDTSRVAYVGRVKKATVTETGVTYFVAFAPDSNWKQFKENELVPAAIMINPPQQAPARGGPTDAYD